jgi:SnoaL-like domain
MATAYESAILDLMLQPEPAWQGDERIAALQDKAEIRDLVMRYGYISDAFLWDELCELYTDDVERILTGTLEETTRGKANLRAKLAAPLLPRRGEGGGEPMERPMVIGSFRSRHLMADDVIRLAPDRGTARGAFQYSLIVETEDDGDYDRGSHEGAYLFDFRRENGRWLFSRQVIITNTARNPLLAKRYAAAR